MEYKQLLDAISYASVIHQGQHRADGVTPYVSHPFRVMTILSQVFGVKDTAILVTAVLHDAIEDTQVNYDGIAKAFGQDIADNVASLTKDMRLPRQAREDKFLQEFEDLPDGVKLCKLGDMLDNLIDTDAIDDSKLASIVGKAQAILERLHPVEQEIALVQDAVKEVKTELKGVD